jgi:cytochrome c oxidase cbb3-type subunit 4
MDLGEIQAYAYFFFTAFLVAVLYGYIFHLYRSEKKGTRDYEKYGQMALDDEVSSKPIEKKEESVDSQKLAKGE